MQQLFEGQTLLFTIPAIVGTGVFFLKLALMMVGGVADGGGAADIDVDMDVDLDPTSDVDAVHADSTAAFKLFSVQAISAFLMGFGCGGLAAKFGFGWNFGLSMGAAAVFGAFMVWLISAGMKFVYDLRSSGNVNIRNAIGREGVVYTQIPGRGEGRGSVRIVIDDRMRIYNAITEGEPIASQTQVRITKINSDNSLTVAAV